MVCAGELMFVSDYSDYDEKSFSLCYSKQSELHDILSSSTL